LVSALSTFSELGEVKLDPLCPALSINRGTSSLLMSGNETVSRF
jgi:hypothetical protein